MSITSLELQQGGLTFYEMGCWSSFFIFEKIGGKKMEKLRLLIIFGLISVIIFVIAGCASTLPPKGEIRESYSLDNFNSFAMILSCEETKVTGVRENFATDYCQVLEGNIKLSLRKLNSKWRYDKKDPDVLIDTKLEEIHGGSAAARFWVGFGAGRSITTVYVKVIKENKVLAEQRITETTTLTNIITNNYANEDAIIQDAPLVSKKIAEFEKNPTEFRKKDSE
jgi:hypothetical protein